MSAREARPRRAASARDPMEVADPAPLAGHHGEPDDPLPVMVARELTRRGWTLALAESCTGGLIAKEMTDHAGASAYFLGAVVAYADHAKQALLGVRRSTLDAHGAVSEPTAREMAEGIRHATGADVALSVTGIAGPGGGSPDKPVGTVWIALAAPDGTEARRYRFAGDRARIRHRAARAALALLRTRLRDGTP